MVYLDILFLPTSPPLLEWSSFDGCLGSSANPGTSVISQEVWEVSTFWPQQIHNPFQALSGTGAGPGRAEWLSVLWVLSTLQRTGLEEGGWEVEWKIGHLGGIVYLITFRYFEICYVGLHLLFCLSPC